MIWLGLGITAALPLIGLALLMRWESRRFRRELNSPLTDDYIRSLLP